MNDCLVDVATFLSSTKVGSLDMSCLPLLPPNYELTSTNLSFLRRYCVLSGWRNPLPKFCIVVCFSRERAVFRLVQTRKSCDCELCSDKSSSYSMGSEEVLLCMEVVRDSAENGPVSHETRVWHYLHALSSCHQNFSLAYLQLPCD